MSLPYPHHAGGGNDRRLGREGPYPAGHPHGPPAAEPVFVGYAPTGVAMYMVPLPGGGATGGGGASGGPVPGYPPSPPQAYGPGDAASPYQPHPQQPQQQRGAPYGYPYPPEQAYRGGYPGGIAMPRGYHTPHAHRGPGAPPSGMPPQPGQGGGYAYPAPGHYYAPPPGYPMPHPGQEPGYDGEAAGRAAYASGGMYVPPPQQHHAGGGGGHSPPEYTAGGGGSSSRGAPEPVSRLLSSRLELEDPEAGVEVLHASCCATSADDEDDDEAEDAKVHGTPLRSARCRLHLQIVCDQSQEAAPTADGERAGIVHYLYAPSHLSAGGAGAGPTPSFTLLHRFEVCPGPEPTSIEVPCELPRGVTAELVLGAHLSARGGAPPGYEVVAALPLVVPPAPPCAPRQLAAAVASSIAVDISWTPPAWDGGAPVSHYELDGRLAEDEEVESDEDGEGEEGEDDPWVRVVDLPASGPCTFHDDSLAADTGYCYRVRAVSTAGLVSGWSALASVRTPPAPPSPPRWVRLTSGAPCSITVAWLPPEDTNGAPISQYIVEIAASDASSGGGGGGGGDPAASDLGSDSAASAAAPGGGVFRQLWCGMSTSATALGLIPGKVMAFRVRAVNAHGASEPSQVVAGMARGFTAPHPPLGLGVDPACAAASPPSPGDDAAGAGRGDDNDDDAAAVTAAVAPPDTEDARRCALVAALPCADHRGVALQWEAPPQPSATPGAVEPPLPPGVRTEYVLQVLNVQYHEKEATPEEAAAARGDAGEAGSPPRDDTLSGDGDETSSIFSSPDARGPVFLSLGEVQGLERVTGLAQPLLLPSSLGLEVEGAAAAVSAPRLLLPGLLQNGPIVTVTAGPGLPGVTIEEASSSSDAATTTRVCYKIGPLVPGGIFMARVATVLKLNPPPGAGPEAAPVLAGSSRFTPWLAFTASPSVPAAPGGLALASLISSPATAASSAAPLLTEAQRLQAAAAPAAFAGALGAELIAAVPPHHGPQISGWAVQVCHKSAPLSEADLPPSSTPAAALVKAVPAPEHPPVPPSPASTAAQPLPLVFICGGTGDDEAGSNAASRWSAALAHAVNDACPVFAQNPQSGPGKGSANTGEEAETAPEADDSAGAHVERIPPALAFHTATQAAAGAASHGPVSALQALAGNRRGSFERGADAASGGWADLGLVEWRSAQGSLTSSPGSGNHNCTVKLILPPVLLSGHAYALRVAAVNACGTGAWSAPIELSVPAGAPLVAPALAPLGVTSSAASSLSLPGFGGGGSDVAGEDGGFVVPTVAAGQEQEEQAEEGGMDSPTLGLPPLGGSGSSSSSGKGKAHTVFTLKAPLPPPATGADRSAPLPTSALTVAEAQLAPALAASVTQVARRPHRSTTPVRVSSSAVSFALWPPAVSGGEAVTWWAVEVADCTSVAAARGGSASAPQPVLVWRRLHAGPLLALEPAADAPCVVKVAGLAPGHRYAFRAAAGNGRGLGPFPASPLLVDVQETVPDAPAAPAAVLVPTAAAAARIAKTVVTATTAGLQASEPDCEPLARVLTGALASTYAWPCASARTPAAAAIKVSWSPVPSHGGLPVLEYAVQAAVFSARAATPVALLGGGNSGSAEQAWEASPTCGTAAVQLWYRLQDCDGFCLRLRRFAARLHPTGSSALPPFLPVYQGPFSTVHLGALPPASGLALRVRARNARGWGPWSSAPLVVFTPPDVPPAPQRPLAVCAAAEAGAAGEGDAASASTAAAGVRALFTRPALPQLLPAAAASSAGEGIDWRLAAELAAGAASSSGLDAGSPLLLSPLPPPSGAAGGLLSPQAGDSGATPGGGVSLVTATLQAAVAAGFSSTVASELLACLATSPAPATEDAPPSSKVQGGLLVSGYEVQRAKIPTSILEAAGIAAGLCGSTSAEGEGDCSTGEAAAASKLTSFLAALLGEGGSSDALAGINAGTAETLVEALRRATITTAAAPEAAVPQPLLAAAAATSATPPSARPLPLPKECSAAHGAKLGRLLPGAWYAVRVAGTNDTGAGAPSPWAVFRVPPAPPAPPTPPQPPAAAVAAAALLAAATDANSPTPVAGEGGADDGNAGKGKARRRTRAESTTSSTPSRPAAGAATAGSTSKVSALLSGAAIDASSVLADVAAMLQAEGRSGSGGGRSGAGGSEPSSPPSRAETPVPTAVPSVATETGKPPLLPAPSPVVKEVAPAAAPVTPSPARRGSSSATAAEVVAATTTASGSSSTVAPPTAAAVAAVKRRSANLSKDSAAASSSSSSSSAPSTTDAAGSKRGGAVAPAAASSSHRVRMAGLSAGFSAAWTHHRVTLIAVIVGLLAIVGGVVLLLQPPAPSHTPLEPVSANTGARGAKAGGYVPPGPGGGVGGGGPGGGGLGRGGGPHRGGPGAAQQRQKHSSNSGGGGGNAGGNGGGAGGGGGSGGHTISQQKPKGRGGRASTPLYGGPRR